MARIALAAALLAGACLACGCDGGEASAPAAHGRGGARPAVAVTLAPVLRQDIESTVDVVGTLFGEEQTTIGAKVPGRVREVFVDVGDRCTPGQELARIDPTDYELAVGQRRMALQEALAKLGLTEMPAAGFDVTTVATVQRAKFQAANAKAKLERARQLFERHPPMISEQDYADLETAYEVAQRDHDVAKLEAESLLAVARTRLSELRAAEQRLDDTCVRAPSAIPETASSASQPALPPFAVTRRNVSAGAYAREGDAMFDLVIDDPIRFRAAVPERYLADVRTGQVAHVRVESYSDPFEGRIRRINPAIDPQSRTFEIEVAVPNGRRLLRPGAFARGVVVIGQQQGVLFVPRQSIVSFAGLDRVFTVKDGKAVEHIVRIGPARGDHVAVLAGVEGSPERVVASGLSRLSQGDAVEFRTAATAPATAPAR